MTSVPTTQDAAAALVVAYKSKHGGASPSESAVTLPLAQLLGEGSLSRYFLGTNNLGAMHATAGFAKAYAKSPGYGMVALLDHAPGPVAYIARFAVVPSLSNGARILLNLIEKMVDLTSVGNASDYSTQLYAHNYFEGMAAPATPAAGRLAAYLANAWTAADQQNIAAYASLITKNLPAAQTAFEGLGSYTGDPSLVTSGPPFATLADRLTPSSAYAPHTLDHARQLLGSAASSPPPGGVSLADCLATPNGDGVWMFGEGLPAVPPAPSPSPTPRPTFPQIIASRQAAAAAGFAVAGVGIVALAITSAALPGNWPRLALEAIT